MLEGKTPILLLYKHHTVIVINPKLRYYFSVTVFILVLTQRAMHIPVMHIMNMFDLDIMLS